MVPLIPLLYLFSYPQFTSTNTNHLTVLSTLPKLKPLISICYDSFSSHKNVLQLVDKLELQTYEQYRKGKTFFQRGEEKKVLVARDSKPFGPLDNYDFNSLVSKVSLTFWYCFLINPFGSGLIFRFHFWSFTFSNSCNHNYHSRHAMSNLFFWVFKGHYKLYNGTKFDIYIVSFVRYRNIFSVEF